MVPVSGRVALCALAFFTTGCAQLVAPPYSADYEALDRLRKAPLGTVAVATVQPTDPDHAVNNLGLRGARLVSASGTFSKYLQDALVADLKEMSVFDPAARTRLDAAILSNEIAIGSITTGTGAMEVELTVTRDGARRLQKKYTARTSFESSFAGAVAVPKGQAEYPVLVRALLRQIYTDPEFASSISN